MVRSLPDFKTDAARMQNNLWEARARPKLHYRPWINLTQNEHDHLNTLTSHFINVFKNNSQSKLSKVFYLIRNIALKTLNMLFNLPIPKGESSLSSAKEEFFDKLTSLDMGEVKNLADYMAASQEKGRLREKMRDILGKEAIDTHFHQVRREFKELFKRYTELSDEWQQRGNLIWHLFHSIADTTQGTNIHWEDFAPVQERLPETESAPKSLKSSGDFNKASNNLSTAKEGLAWIFSLNTPPRKKISPEMVRSALRESISRGPAAAPLTLEGPASSQETAPRERLEEYPSPIFHNNPVDLQPHVGVLKNNFIHYVKRLLSELSFNDSLENHLVARDFIQTLQQADLADVQAINEDLQSVVEQHHLALTIAQELATPIDPGQVKELSKQLRAMLQQSVRSQARDLCVQLLFHELSGLEVRESLEKPSLPSASIEEKQFSSAPSGVQEEQSLLKNIQEKGSPSLNFIEANGDNQKEPIEWHDAKESFDQEDLVDRTSIPGDDSNTLNAQEVWYDPAEELEQANPRNEAGKKIE